MEHLALTIFSICVQAAIGIMVFVAIGRFFNKEGVFKNAMLTAAGLGIIGMFASLLHLGRPLSAIRALSQFGSSWLSREIWFTALFVGLAVLAVIVANVKPQSKSTITGLTSAAALVGLVNIFFMAAIYNTTSVPVWQGSATFVEFFAAAVSIGATLFLLLSIKEVTNMEKIIALAVAAAVILQVAAVVPDLIIMGGSSSGAVQSSLIILGGMTMATVFKWIFILAGAVLVVWMAKDELSKSMTNIVLSGVVLILAGQVIGRYLFYAAMVVTRVGLS